MNPRAQTDEEREYYSFQERGWKFFAPFYDAVVLPIRRLRSEVASMVDMGSGARILDVATGTGAQAFAFAAKAGSVVGIDMSEAMLRIARRKNRFPNVMFQQADASELPFDDEIFDAACVSFALHEMPSSIREHVVREMVRVTKPGGIIVVVDYGLPSNRVASSVVFQLIKLYEGDHYATFIESNLADMLERVGIDVMQQRSRLHGVAQILIGRRRGEGTAPSVRPRTS